MILVAESGSTKCDWLLLNTEGDHVASHQTMGFNPYHHSAEFIENKLRENDSLRHLSDVVRETYFFGAGCSSQEMNEIIQSALTSYFQNSTVQVDHDLKAAAYSTWQGSPCISCILGTGSNSCYFDGDKIHQEVPSLAYILGDEGSGSYFGKKLLRQYFYKQLPEHLNREVSEQYGLTKDEVMQRVYREPFPNVYLAGLMPFIVHHRRDPFIRKWILNGFETFFDCHVLCFKDYSQVPVHFVGSIADLLKEELKKVAAAKSVQVGNIIRKPGYRLAEYVWEHRDRLR